ncbi:MAG: DnaD domain protein [Eubacteriales bacterium]|nr:DnaD domain protein [Eubacteriales bacterium]
MGHILLSGGGTGTTVLSNIFIDEYMKDANDAQLKVYLFLVRMLQSGEPVSVSDMADRFNHTEKDILRALCYWEKRGIVALTLAPDRTLSQIRLLPFCVSGQETADRQTADGLALPDKAEEITVDLSASHSEKQPEEPDGASPSRVRLLSRQALDLPDSFEKPAYTLDELKSFRQQENTAQLIFVAEQYLGRTLTPSDMKSILFFTDRLHFSDDLIDYLLQYCVERGKKDFRYIEKVAIGWAESGVTTPAEAEGHVSRYDRTVYSIMNALGKTSAPARSELSYIRRWTQDYGFELEVILEACSRTVLATDRHRFAYADSILSAWYKAGVHHVSDIAGLDSSFQKEKNARPARTGSTAEYNRFMHSSYDFDALEEALLK